MFVYYATERLQINAIDRLRKIFLSVLIGLGAFDPLTCRFSPRYQNRRRLIFGLSINLSITSSNPAVMAKILNRITNCLWFDKEAEEAAKFYTSIFPDSGIDNTAYYGKEGFEFHGMPEGSVLTIEFILDGQEFIALNGGPHFQFNEAVSFVINCDTQEEVDYYWNKLTEGGDAKAQMCGWLKDRFGLSWQVVPTVLADMMTDEDPAKVARVNNAVFQMKKLDIPQLEAAFGK